MYQQQYSAIVSKRYGESKQPCRTPFSTVNQSLVYLCTLTFDLWAVYRDLISDTMPICGAKSILNIVCQNSLWNTVSMLFRSQWSTGTAIQYSTVTVTGTVQNNALKVNLTDFGTPDIISLWHTPGTSSQSRYASVLKNCVLRVSSDSAIAKF